MTTNSAPVPNFPGMDFNDSFYSSTSGAYVNYPTAQGTVTLPKVLTGELDSSTPAVSNNMFSTLTGNLNLATNGATGQIISIGNTNATVRCASVDHQSNSINSVPGSSGTLNLCNNLTTGTLNIGTNTARSGPLNIGNGVGATGTVYLGSTSGSTVLNGTVSVNGSFALPSILTAQQINATSASTEIDFANTSTSGLVAIAPVQTNGNLNIGTNTARTGTINIGNGAGSTGGINIGVSGNTTTVGGALSTAGISASGNISTTGTSTISTSSTGKMQSSYYDAIADTTAGTTALRIGNNVVLGDIEIGNAQTTGDIKIGLSDTSGATITVGTSSTVTTINGTLTTSNGTIAGRSATFVVDALSLTTSSVTLSPSSVNMISSMVFFGSAVAAYPYIIPTGFTLGQKITFKNGSSNNITLSFTDNIVLNTANSSGGVSSVVLASGSILDAWYVNNWYQINASSSLALNGTLSLTNPITLPTTSPTLDKTSLNYFVNYANVSRNGNSTGYVYSPASNSATTDTHYLNAGIYVADIKMSWYEVSSPSATTFTYTMSVNYNQTIGALSTTSPSGTNILSSLGYTPLTLSKNQIPIGYSYTGCFILPSANYVNLLVSMVGIATGGTVTINMSGCIRRIG